MSMTEDSADVSEFLEHFGIKGMKWGVRRADKKWERSFRRPSLELQEKIIKDANYKFDNEDLPKINNKPEYKKIDLTKAPLLQDLYFHEVEVAFTKRMGTVIQEHYGKNPSGTKEVTVTDDGYAVISEVEHSTDSTVKVKLKMDDTGHIVSADITQEFIEAFIDLDEEESMEQDALDPTTEFLEHFGVKGMKWGVRRGEKRLHNKRVKMFGEDEANRLYFDNISKRTYKKVQTEALKNVKEPIKKIDSKPEYSDVNLLMNKRAMDDYYHEIDRAFEKELDKSLVNVLGSDKSPSGKFTAKHQIDPDTGAVKILVLKQKEISHDNSEMVFDVEIDEKGHVLDIVPTEELTQDAVKNVDEFLEHHGIKGMKWGVRRKRGSNGLVGGPRPKKGELGLEGKGRRPSDEGREAHKILAKQKKHGTVSLTNHELRTINARQKLEQEFIKVNPNKGKIEKGHDKVKKYLAIGVTAKSAYDLFNSPAGKALRGKGADNITQAQLNKYMWKQTMGKLGSY